MGRRALSESFLTSRGGAASMSSVLTRLAGGDPTPAEAALASAMSGMFVRHRWLVLEKVQLLAV